MSLVQSYAEQVATEAARATSEVDFGDQTGSSSPDRNARSRSRDGTGGEDRPGEVSVMTAEEEEARATTAAGSLHCLT